MSGETFFHWVTQYGYFGIFSLLMLGIVGLPVPDELLLTFCGYLVFKGTLQPAPTVMAALMGSVTGITLSYIIGRWAGASAIAHWGPRFHLTPQRLENVHQWFERLGKWVLFIGYFVPGVRHFTALVAGTSKLEFPTFAIYAYAGALFWSATFITTGYFLGEQWTKVSGGLHRHLLLISGCALLLIILIWLIQRRMSRDQK